MDSIKESIERHYSLFFFATDTGLLCLGDDVNHCSEVCKISGHIKCLLYYEKENSTIIITSHMLLIQFKLSNTERIVPSRKVKLSVAGEPESIQAIWVGEGLIAINCCENMIRLMNLEKDENYVLSLADPMFDGALVNDKIISIAYNSKKLLICCGTMYGNIVIWQCKSVLEEAPISAEGWEPKKQTKTQLKNIQEILYGSKHGIICGLVSKGMILLIETQLKKKMRDSIQVIQTTQKSVEVQQLKKTGISIKSEFGIKGVDCSQNHVLIWSGKDAHIYEISSVEAKKKGSFECKSILLGILNDNVVVCNDNAMSS